MMFLVYLYGGIAMILTVYTIVEKKRLLFYKEMNQIKLGQDYLSVQNFSSNEITHSAENG